MSRLRTIVVVAAAAGTFGGTVGALAAAAVQSQANPEAIAAAVQRVSDSKAEASLRAINAKLGAANTHLGTMQTDLGTVQTDLGTIQSALTTLNNSNEFGAPFYSVARNLQKICENTAPEPIVSCWAP